MKRLVWLNEHPTGATVVINPEYVMSLRPGRAKGTCEVIMSTPVVASSLFLVQGTLEEVIAKLQKSEQIPLTTSTSSPKK